MNRPIRRVAFILLALLALQILVVTYWQGYAADRLQDDPRNIRPLLFRAGRQRGLIISADNQILARSVNTPDDLYQYRREYPYGGLYAHTVGFSSLLFEDTGLEQVYTSDLASGRDFTVSGMINALLGEDLRSRSIQLTLHHDLTEAAAQALGNRSGAVAVLDPQTGAILALVSSPRFNPNLLIGADSQAAWNNLRDDPAQPLKNRALDESYLPGATFSVVTTASALENRVAQVDTLFLNSPSLPGSELVIGNPGGCQEGNQDQITLEDAFIFSCEAVLARLGTELGADLLVETAHGLGFNQQLPLDLPAQSSVLPTSDLFSGDLETLALTSIGRQQVRSTAFQMALVTAAVANQGVLMEPFLVQRIFDADSAVQFESAPGVYATPLSSDTALGLESIMEKVVARGTGIRAHIPGVRVAGKTGSSEQAAWFVGFAPVGSPDLAIAVVVEVEDENQPGAAGETIAAPIAGEIMDFWLRGDPVDLPVRTG